jgi:hypothetical protein
LIRKHLTYANVASTLALFLALGTGAVYAAGEIGSNDIKNNSVRSKDLKDGQSVAGRDVRRNALGSREVDEDSLAGRRIVGLDGAQGADCDPQDSTWIDCAVQPLDLKSPSRLLIIVTGGFYSEADGAEAECEVRLDNQDAGPSAAPGEVLDNTSGLATDGFARTLVTGVIPAGSHSAALACQQIGSEDARIDSPTIAVIAVTTG